MIHKKRNFTLYTNKPQPPQGGQPLLRSSSRLYICNIKNGILVSGERIKIIAETSQACVAQKQQKKKMLSKGIWKACGT